VDEPTVVVGRITKAHGLRGEVAVQVFSDNPDRFAEGALVYLEDGRPLTVSAARWTGARLLIAFDGVADRTAAEALRGRSLVVPRSMLPELAAGEYWPHQLIGCEVLTESGRSLGRVTDVIEHPANDLWAATDDEGVETLIPAIRDVVVEVDVGAGRVVVRELPGLTAPDPPSTG
jgi:16S rRNA processing protein RimM